MQQPLRKWCTNSPELLQKISARSPDPLFVIKVGEQDTVNSLGLLWNPNHDSFHFFVRVLPRSSVLTKRCLLSDISRVFDPLGFLTPVLIKGKIFIQQLWQVKLNWDEPLPIELQSRWLAFYRDLEALKNISIPRFTSVTLAVKLEIHGFCDASQDAYGACLYLRSQRENGEWESHLLCSKSRVTPLAPTSIPRLELCGAVLLIELARKVATSLDLDIKTFHLWTDSMVVMAWIRGNPAQWKTYVANRVAQILDSSTADQWNHVISEDNPADLVSRGISAASIISSSLWFHGPNWLVENSPILTSILINPPEESMEIKKIKFALTSTVQNNELIERYSSWNRLIRISTWIRRFIKNSKLSGALLRNDRIIGHLKVHEIQETINIWCKISQIQFFEREIVSLSKCIELHKKSKIRSLNPYIDSSGLIRVGGRLQGSDLTKEQKHPVILPYGHRVTRLIFQTYHDKLLHSGPQLLLSEIRTMYWPLKGRLLARSTILHCVQCTRAKPRFQIPLMAPLPQQRVQCSRPFTITGVDFAGPLTIRSGVRGRANRKAWISLFICFATKAIHIEVVEDLTSSAFIATLRRFMARRGKPTEVWSDNGTNFVGAQRELATYLKSIEGDSVEEGITWRFNPPSAPHFGGLWESAVKSDKYHLTRVLKDTKLTLIEFQTLLCQIEACLNSRPLTPMSNDPNDLRPLTPAHFLVGGPMLMHPEPDLSREEPNGLRRWRFVQFLMQNFWQRWHNEYLPQLQTRGKWTSGSEPLKVNDVVIVKEDNTPPMKWKLARIVQVHPGKDGKTRVVTVHMANGLETQRPVAKLCRLPIEEEEIVEK